MSELEEAIILASRVLGDASADPDGDLSMLARQFLRSRERERGFVVTLKELKDLVVRIEAFPPAQTELRKWDNDEDGVMVSLSRYVEEIVIKVIH